MEYNCACVVHVGIQVSGTREEAEEQVNKLTAFLQVTCQDNGITFTRQKQSIIQKPGVDNGRPEQLDEGSLGNGTNVVTE